MLSANKAEQAMENHQFPALLAYPQPNVEHYSISHSTLVREISALYTVKKAQVTNLLRAHIATRGRVSLTMYTWTSSARQSFFAVTVHYAYLLHLAPQTIMKSVLLAFQPLENPTTTPGI
jgi:hypothetical protein